MFEHRIWHGYKNTGRYTSMPNPIICHLSFYVYMFLSYASVPRAIKPHVVHWQWIVNSFIPLFKTVSSGRWCLHSAVFGKSDTKTLSVGIYVMSSYWKARWHGAESCMVVKQACMWKANRSKVCIITPRCAAHGGRERCQGFTVSKRS